MRAPDNFPTARKVRKPLGPFTGEPDYSRAVLTRYVAPADARKVPPLPAEFGVTFAELGAGRYLDRDTTVSRAYPAQPGAKQ